MLRSLLRRRSLRVALRSAATSTVLALVVLGAGFAGGFMTGWSDLSATHASDGRTFVAITFDDGLNGSTTRTTADILEEHGARGTFFVVGKTLKPQVTLARELVDRGHLLANHSQDHVRARRSDILYTEIERAQASFQQVIGRCPRFYRPPWGVQTRWVNAAVRREGMQTVLWDDEAGDWAEQDAEQLAKHILERVKPGAIILLHDGKEGTANSDHSVMLAALPVILEGLKERGLTPVRLDELLGTTGYLDRCR